MIHIITAENRALYRAEMLEYHRVRHDVYIVERKWVGLEDRNGLEFDRYDTDETTYLLAIEDGRVLGGTRFFPSTRPHMLEEVCPQLAEVRGIPRGDDIWEWTRIFVVKDRRDGRFGGTVVGQLFSAALEYGLANDVTALSVVFEAWWLPRLQGQGWKLKPLGLPGLINGDWWIAALLLLDPETLFATRGFYGLEGPVLTHRGLKSRAKSPGATTWAQC